MHNAPNWTSVGIDPVEVLARLWGSSVLGLTLITEEGRFLYPSDQLCEMLEYSSSELERMTYVDVTDPQDAKADMKMAKAVASGDIDSYVMAIRYITKTGKRIWIKLRVEGMYDQRGKLIMYLSQIAPAEVWNPTAPVITKATPTSAKFVTFMQDNWKWLIPTLSAIAAFISWAGVKYNEFIKALQLINAE